jgi:transcriptional regulator with XRE-family HTH domain
MAGDFKSNLRDELDFQGLTVKELSAKTGIAKGTLDCYLGVRASMPPADVAVKIARALGITVEYLISGEERPQNQSIPVFSRPLRSLIETSQTLNKRDTETLLGLALILKSQTEKAKNEL